MGETTTSSTSAGSGSSARAMVGLVRGYQRWVSPVLPARCRFYPSCSSYAVQAIEERGAVTGLALATYRIVRCNPWARGGVDHVPARGERWASWDGVVDHRGDAEKERTRAIGVGLRSAQTSQTRQ